MSFIPVITGIGLATAQGPTLLQTWSRLCQGHAVLDHARVPDLPQGEGARVCRICRQAAREAIAGAGWTAAEVESAALIVGTSKGPIDQWLETARVGLAGVGGTEVGGGAAYGLADLATATAVDLGMYGPKLTYSAACASGLIALTRGIQMLKAGIATRVLVAAAESSLHALFVGSFSRLGVIAPAGHGCRPFDTTRAGFVIGESAAAVCLEAAGPLLRDDRIWAAIDGAAWGADATHLTAGDPNAVTLRRLIGEAIDGRSVDLVHAHGTGTIYNDAVELSAIEAMLVGEKPPLLYSHKAALGHSLGAAGLTAVAINCLCHRYGQVPPNVHTRNPLPARRVVISPNLETRPVQRSLAIAAGFGGAIAAVTLQSL